MNILQYKCKSARTFRELEKDYVNIFQVQFIKIELIYD